MYYCTFKFIVPNIIILRIFISILQLRIHSTFFKYFSLRLKSVSKGLKYITHTIIHMPILK